MTSRSPYYSTLARCAILLIAASIACNSTLVPQKSNDTSKCNAEILIQFSHNELSDRATEFFTLVIEEMGLPVNSDTTGWRISERGAAGCVLSLVALVNAQEYQGPAFYLDLNSQTIYPDNQYASDTFARLQVSTSNGLSMLSPQIPTPVLSPTSTQTPTITPPPTLFVVTDGRKYLPELGDLPAVFEIDRANTGPSQIEGGKGYQISFMNSSNMLGFTSDAVNAQFGISIFEAQAKAQANFSGSAADLAGKMTESTSSVNAKPFEQVDITVDMADEVMAVIGTIESPMYPINMCMAIIRIKNAIIVVNLTGPDVGNSAKDLIRDTAFYASLIVDKLPH